MPSCELFDKQTDSYKNEILPKNIVKISIEAGSTIGWYKYADFCFGIDRFGCSGNLHELKEYFGFTKERIIQYICNCKNK